MAAVKVMLPSVIIIVVFLLGVIPAMTSAGTVSYEITGSIGGLAGSTRERLEAILQSQGWKGANRTTIESVKRRLNTILKLLQIVKKDNWCPPHWTVQMCAPRGSFYLWLKKVIEMERQKELGNLQKVLTDTILVYADLYASGRTQTTVVPLAVTVTASNQQLLANNLPYHPAAMVANSLRLRQPGAKASKRKNHDAHTKIVKVNSTMPFSLRHLERQMIRALGFH